MNAQDAVLDHYRRQAGEYLAASAPETSGLMEKRQRALGRLTEVGVPDRRQEAWRYTGIEGLLKADFRPLGEVTPPPARARVEALCLDADVAGRAVFVDGVFRAEYSHLQDTAVEVTPLRAALAAGDRAALEAIGSLSGAGAHLFEALNLATLLDGALIKIGDGHHEARPFELLHLTTSGADRHSVNIRHLLQLGREAKMQLVERYQSLDDSLCFTNQVMEILLGDGAYLRHERVQMEGARGYHLGEIHLQPGGGSHYRACLAAIGAAWSRTGLHLRFAEEGAGCEIDGLYLAGDGQLTDHHLDIDHAVSACNSRATFKGLLSGQGRAVFDGRVAVQPGAQKTDAHLGNANLMLSRMAEVDTKPQLEIYADDVQCSHGTTVGQLDEEALFYLRSRGLDAAEARRMLSLAFAGEILERFPTAALREVLTQDVAGRLAQSLDGEEH